MLSKKQNLIFYYKICSLTFIIFVFGCFFYHLEIFGIDVPKLKIIKIERPQNINFKIENKFIKDKVKFYVLAFALGAYWNMNHIHKIGIL